MRLLIFLLLASCLGPVARSATPPALPAEIEVAPLPTSGAVRHTIAQGLARALSQQRDLLGRQAEHLAARSRSTQRWLALPIEVDTALLASPDAERELSVRFLQRALLQVGFLLPRAHTEALLRRWQVRPRGQRLAQGIEAAQRLHRPILYRGDLELALRQYSEMLREDARRLEEALTRLASERHAEEGILSFYTAQYNALVLVLRGLGELPVAPLNLVRTLEGQGHIPGLGHWLAQCQERAAANGRPQAGGIDRSWRAPCVLRTLPYVGEYGQKYGASLETGALLGMMTPSAGAVLQGALTKTLGPGARWLSTQAGEGGAQLVRMLGWWLRKGGQAFAIEAAIDVGRGFGILWRGGEELPDGRFQPLGPEEAMALLERILVQLGVAKNVKELFEETPVEERERAGSPQVLVSRIRPEKPVPAAEVMRRWVAPFRRKPTPRGTPAQEYEARHTGPENIQVQGGGAEIFADGVRLDGYLQEAKHVGDLVNSPYVPESSCRPRARARILRRLDEEFGRYAAVIRDPMTPVVGLEVITNHPSAAVLFLARLEHWGIPGRVIVKP